MTLEIEALKGELSSLREELDAYKKLHADNCAEYDKAVADREHFRNLVRNYDTLDEENKRLQSLIEAYNRIFTHNLVPDKGFYYFICGEGGEKDDNNLPKQIHICPAYGVDWFQVYERTDKTFGPEW